MEFIPLVTKIQAIEAELRSSRRGAQDVIATISIAINGEERQKVRGRIRVHTLQYLRIFFQLPM